MLMLPNVPHFVGPLVCLTTFSPWVQASQAPCVRLTLMSVPAHHARMVQSVWIGPMPTSAVVQKVIALCNELLPSMLFCATGGGIVSSHEDVVMTTAQGLLESDAVEREISPKHPLHLPFVGAFFEKLGLGVIHGPSSLSIF